MNFSLKTAEGAHREFVAAHAKLLQQYAGKLTLLEMLALTVHVTGQLIAMQDQRTVTRELALALVIKNLERGNNEVILNLTKTTGSA